MKVVLTLLVRDEADIVDAHLAYHLNAGVDFVIATDHRSGDGTLDVLESYAAQGVLRLFRESGEFTRQGDWQTRMARLAATDHGADWVINSDADEFWWPRGGSLDDVLRAVPDEYGVVRALVRNFLPLRDDSGSLAERMTVRLATPAPINDPATPFRPVVKVAHRAHPNVRIPEGGCHQVFGVPGPLLDAWYPLDVLHMPLRSRAQFAAKYRKTWTGWQVNLRGDLARAREADEQGRLDAMWSRVALDEAALKSGFAHGSLVEDPRLREVLTPPRVNVPRGTVRPEASEVRPALGRADDVRHAVEAAVFDQAEIVRAQRWVDELLARVSRLERPRRGARKA